jgi:DNA-binding protein HU-beta
MVPGGQNQREMAMTHLTKTQVIADIATATGQSKAEVGHCLDALFHFIALMEVGDKVVLTGFGTFERKMIAARMGRNMRTGAPMEVAAHPRLTFKASKAKG